MKPFAPRRPRLWLHLNHAAAAGVWCCLIAGEVHAQCEWQAFEAININVGETFGSAVVVGPGMFVVGAQDRQTVEGTVQVFRRSPDGWALQTVVHSGEVDVLNMYGIAAAMDGGQLVVGDAEISGYGAVYVYSIGSGPVVFEQKLSGTDVGGGFFGGDVSVSGNAILVTAEHKATSGLVDAGAAYVFRRVNDAWTLEKELTAPTPKAGDAFGSDVAIFGDVAAVGALGVDGPTSSITGAAFIYRYVRGVWQLEQKLVPTDPATGEKYFGAAVALAESGATLAVGAERTGGNKGAVHMYAYDGREWVLTQVLVPPAAAGNARFGGDVALSEDGQTLVVGAYADYSVAPAAGAAYIYRLVNGVWQQVYEFAKPDGWCVGAHVAIHGDIVVVSDPCYGNFSGRVHVIAGAQQLDCNGNRVNDGCDIASGFSQDVNQNGVPDECDATSISPDLNGDGVVDGVDLGVLLGSWGECPVGKRRSRCDGDLNGDGVVSGVDLGVLLGAWGRVAGQTGCGASGSCCVPHGTPGCEDSACCGAICASDPFCCASYWDAICANAAQGICGCPPPTGCGDPNASDCCLTGRIVPGVPGCSDGACCELVCDYMDPFCCEVAWDDECATWASQFCAPCRPVACGQSSNDCCDFNFDPYDPGCNDSECCTIVCGIDPYCCDTSWDIGCTLAAWQHCPACGGTPLP